jgi:UDP-N-acetylglucosamine 2-epimerase
MLEGLEELFASIGPDAVLVYGDTNTTLAAALAAVKMGIPVAHVEAGLRSFNRSMPEEINRIAVDHIADILLCPSQAAMNNLAVEGLARRALLVGDVMLDTVRMFAENRDSIAVTAAHGVKPGGYHLATVHRAATSDDPEALARIIDAFASLESPVLWAIHPRTRANLEAFGLMPALERAESIRAVEPLPYSQTVALLSGARALLTDSGGMQKEAYFLGVPCLTLRDETEWVETVELGWNTLVGTDPERIRAAVVGLQRPTERPLVYGDGHASERVAAAITTLGVR